MNSGTGNSRYENELLDLLKIYPVTGSCQFEVILPGLNAMSPRLYTIASSPAAHEGEVHIVAVKDHYTVNGEMKFGLCSEYLSELVVDGKQNFFVQQNKRFRLPVPEKDMIMVGPGTGIAAFRSFLAESDVTGARVKTAVCWGPAFHNRLPDQTEIQNWYETGVLTKINLAFSRDAERESYVQLMLATAGELYQWLEAALISLSGYKDPIV